MFNFMIENIGVGPFGIEVPLEGAQIGDVIQLQNEDGIFYHTIIISEILDGEIYICANSNDALDKPLSEYNYASLRVIHILGVRFDTRFQIDCFDSLYSPPLQPIEQENNEPPQEEIEPWAPVYKHFDQKGALHYVHLAQMEFVNFIFRGYFV